ncbi:MAG: hypothetical protein OXC19_15065 [Bryobacterales bacterium]|nr:hypothetical protein [Bryobacterales bacterium]
MPNNKLHSRNIVLTALASVVALALGLACSGGPSGPAQGSPEWYMQAARENFAIPDYAKTIEQLSEAMGAEGEIGTTAMLWHSVTTAGLARGYSELGSAFMEGIEANEARAADFQNFVNDYRRRTRINAIEFSEGVGKIQALIQAQPSVSLDFPLPPGNDSVSPVLTSVRSGTNAETQIAGMEAQTLTRGIFSVLSDLTGGKSAEDLTSTAEAGTIEATSDEIAFGVSRILLDISIMFDREGINDPRVRGHVLGMAEKWVEPYLEDEDSEAVEEFKFDLENERRDIEGKRRIAKE